MRAPWVSVLMFGSAVLSSCGENLTSEEQAMRDERDIAMVEKANRGLTVPVTPEPILYPDMEKNDLYGTGCAFVPEGGGLGAVALAMTDKGYMKVEGKIVRFSADSGSAALPFGAHARYDGKEHFFVLALADGKGRQSGAEAMNYNGRLTLRDSRGDTVYDKAGEIQCRN